MANSLINVQTYQMAGLGFLLNEYPFVANANKKFLNFQTYTGQLGDTVLFEKPPRMTTRNSLVIAFESAVQRFQPLSVKQEVSSAVQFTGQQMVFNDLEDYMERFGKAQIKEIGTQIESYVAGISERIPYRFFGDGVTQINSFGQLAQIKAQFEEFGCDKDNFEGYLNNLSIPGIVNSGLGQFAMDRNNELARKWQIGEFEDTMWYRSNLLPLHVAGTEGKVGTTLTVVSFTTNATGGVVTITFSGTNAANDPNSVQAFDNFQFQDAVAGQPNVRFLTWIGHKPTGLPVQFQATAQAASTAGSQVTVSINPPLQAAAGTEQNVNNPIAVGMQVKVLPDHRCGLFQSGKPLFFAMPQLPDQAPFPTANAYDEDTGTSLRLYTGAIFGQNQQGMVHDAIYDATGVPENMMQIVFPA